MPTQQGQTYDPLEEPAPRGSWFRLEERPYPGRLHRAFRALALVVLLAAASTAALAIDKGVDDLLRVASASAAIIQFCAPRYAVDTEFAFGFGKAASEAAYQVLGAEDGKTEMLGEMSRRFDEVKAMGEDRWCRAERALYRENNVPIFKD